MPSLCGSFDKTAWGKSFFFLFLSDFIFVQGPAVIFKVALCLLSSHEAEIVECDGFESIVDYLKTTLPALSQTQMEQTIVKVPTWRSRTSKGCAFSGWNFTF